MIKGIIQDFLPWILFSLLIGPTQHELNTAIISASVATLLFSYKGLRDGFILSWGTLFAFTFLLISVVILHHDWIGLHSSIFTNGALVLIVLTSILVGKPFTLQYAKRMVDKKHWESPLFLSNNKILTNVWGLIFLFGTLMNIFKIYHPDINQWIYESLSDGTTIFGVWFTSWFPAWNKARKLKTG